MPKSLSNEELDKVLHFLSHRRKMNRRIISWWHLLRAQYCIDIICSFRSYGSFKHCGCSSGSFRSFGSVVRAHPHTTEWKFYFVFVIEFHGGGLPSSALWGKNKFKIWDFSTFQLGNWIWAARILSLKLRKEKVRRFRHPTVESRTESWEYLALFSINVRIHSEHQQSLYSETCWQICPSNLECSQTFGSQLMKGHFQDLWKLYSYLHSSTRIE